MDDFDRFLELSLAAMLDRVVKRPAPPRRALDAPHVHALVGGLSEQPAEDLVAEAVPLAIAVPSSAGALTP